MQGCAKTRREIPNGRPEREFSRFFLFCEAIGLEIWGWPWPPQSFRTTSVDLSHCQRAHGMTACCAFRPAGVDVNRTLRIALRMSHLGDRGPTMIASGRTG